MDYAKAIALADAVMAAQTAYFKATAAVSMAQVGGAKEPYRLKLSTIAGTLYQALQAATVAYTSYREVNPTLRL